MDSIEKEMKKLYPFWNSLSEKEKIVVSDIASQIPMNCESVATIFLIHGASDRNLTIDYIKMQYGFVVN